MIKNKNLEVKEKNEITGQAEQTKPGRVFSPDVDIFENSSALVLLADMPGVNAENLTIDLKDNTLTITGDVAPVLGSDEDPVITEYFTGRYARQFSLTEAIDQDRIEANLDAGVLRLVLPKVQKALPRKIEVKAA